MNQLRKVSIPIERLWLLHATKIYSLAIFLMILAAIWRISFEFYRLVWDTGYYGAIDLGFIHKAIHLWFSNEPVYGEVVSTYPPASYVMLWPFTGWLSFSETRWIWAVTSILAMAWLIRLLIKESGADSSMTKVFIGLMPLSIGASMVTVGNGQLGIHLLPALVAGILLFHSRNYSLIGDLAGTIFILFALVKPSLTAPFFWIVLFVRNRIRPAFLIVFAYMGLTFFAATFQDSGVINLMQDWWASGMGAIDQNGSGAGYANIHRWLVDRDLEAWSSLTSLIILAILGGWVYRFRKSDIWVLMGVAAIFARFWTYHRVYDDILILLPLIALFRITTTKESSGNHVVAGLLFVAILLGLLAPARLPYSPYPWDMLYGGGQTIAWFGLLWFLLRHAWKECEKPRDNELPAKYL